MAAAIPESPLDLSAREVEILGLIAEGLTNREVGARIDRSPATVKSHLYRIYSRIDARDRAHAVALAFRAGLLR